MQSLVTCLMFGGEQHGRADEAVNFYLSVFDEARLIDVVRYGDDDEEPTETIKHARFSLAGREFIAMDGGRDHAFSLTPAMSIFVDCDREDEVDELYAKLEAGGSVLMPLEAYPFSPRFAWVEDRFGVSWQLNLAAKDARWRG